MGDRSATVGKGNGRCDSAISTETTAAATEHTDHTATAQPEAHFTAQGTGQEFSTSTSCSEADSRDSPGKGNGVGSSEPRDDVTVKEVWVSEEHTAESNNEGDSARGNHTCAGADTDTGAGTSGVDGNDCDKTTPGSTDQKEAATLPATVHVHGEGVPRLAPSIPIINSTSLQHGYRHVMWHNNFMWEVFLQVGPVCCRPLCLPCRYSTLAVASCVCLLMWELFDYLADAVSTFDCQLPVLQFFTDMGQPKKENQFFLLTRRLTQQKKRKLTHD